MAILRKHTVAQHKCLCPCGDPVCPLTSCKGVCVCMYLPVYVWSRETLASRDIQGSLHERSIWTGSIVALSRYGFFLFFFFRMVRECFPSFWKGRRRRKREGWTVCVWCRTCAKVFCLFSPAVSVPREGRREKGSAATKGSQSPHERGIGNVVAVISPPRESVSPSLSAFVCRPASVSQWSARLSLSCATSHLGSARVKPSFSWAFPPPQKRLLLYTMCTGWCA